MDQRLKQRLVGATVLLALAVIFIPIILEGPEDKASPRAGSIPMPPAHEFEARVEPAEESDLIPAQPAPALGIDMGAGEETAAEVAIPAAVPETERGMETETQTTSIPIPPPADETAATQAPSVNEAAPRVESPRAEAKPPQPAPAATKTPAPVSGKESWVVQVGSFSNQQNARGLRDRLRSAGYATFVERAQTGQSVVYRVLVGPYLERGKAEGIRDKLAAQQQLKGIVTGRS
jgi:DedD protein